MTSTQSLPAREYEGYVAFTDGTRWSLQCYEDRHDECPGVVPDDSGSLDAWNCECAGCPAHPGDHMVIEFDADSADAADRMLLEAAVPGEAPLTASCGGRFGFVAEGTQERVRAAAARLDCRHTAYHLTYRQN
jgi:hypothetical protein